MLVKALIFAERIAGRQFYYVNYILWCKSYLQSNKRGGVILNNKDVIAS